MLIHQPENIIFLTASQQQTAYQYQSGHPKRHQPSEEREEKVKRRSNKKKKRLERRHCEGTAREQSPRNAA
jgi:hypothetical protein